MKRAALLVLAVALSACAPQVTAPQPAQPPAAPPVTTPAQTDGASLSVTLGLNYQAVVLRVGTVPASTATVWLTGAPLRVNDNRCQPDGLDLKCTLGPLDAGSKRTIYASGLWKARAVVVRPDGNTVTLNAP